MVTSTSLIPESPHSSSFRITSTLQKPKRQKYEVRDHERPLPLWNVSFNNISFIRYITYEMLHLRNIVIVIVIVTIIIIYRNLSELHYLIFPPD